ncbi:type II toxin-antitoxin system VapC family toxin [Phenylobacterium sp. 20VBR1]|uniref:Ribonuclease VapC n=1 Tax=Phenylobacterium glaciei TaxID=2803784 RepID=A0A941HWQ5_9CAUL|nr:type II toxin-antitoxin system VapC family toxin [Phenylobacterium glaciei]MBR7621169.1 type II toxin-antitoxin system VapC family toxin [Phenylobacterium glaciei]
MMVVDASALVALSDGEDDAAAFAEALQNSAAALISSVNAFEAGLVLIGRGRLSDEKDLNRWLSEIGVTVYAGGADHTEALRAYLAFGRGYHPARLNLGDSFAYALAKKLDAPLLYKGDDFARTDIRSALQPT